LPLNTDIIASGIKPYEAPDLAAIQGKQLTLANLGLQNRSNQLALDQAQQAQADTQALNNVYKSNINPDGTVNRAGLIQGVAQAGMGSKLPGIQKTLTEADTAQLTNQKTQLEVHKAKVDAVGDRIASLLSNPQVTHDQVVQSIASLVQDGTIDAQTGAGMVQAVPGDPNMLRQWLVSKGMEAHADSARMAQLLPKFEYKDTGKTLQPVDINTVTNPHPTPLQMTTTPGQDQSARIDRARLAQEGGAVTYQTDASGNIVALPTHPAGGPLVAKPAIGPDGQPLQGAKGALNESQANALLLGNRARAADAILNQLGQKGVNFPGALSSMDHLPLVGGVAGAVGNYTASGDQQQVSQAQRDFINAVLRKESGAAISPTEFESAAKQYFPQRGDSEAVIAQKAANRKREIEGLLAAVPQGQRPGAVQNGAAAPPVPGLLPGATDNGQINFKIPDDIDAIINKHLKKAGG
jgi:hypothetical protein